MRAGILGILLAFAFPALAWEPTSPAAVQARIEELQKAWAGKSPEEIAQDKIARARQPRPQDDRSTGGTTTSQRSSTRWWSRRAEAAAGACAPRRRRSLPRLRRRPTAPDARRIRSAPRPG